MRAVRGSTFAKLNQCIVFDVETTGLNPKTHRIVSIAALKVTIDELLLTNSSNVKTFHAIIDPERNIPTEASNIHNLWKKDVDGQGNFSEHADQLIDFMEDLPLIAHNCEFDASFFDAAFRRAGMPEVMGRPLFCTMKRACHHMSNAGKYRSRVSLVDACEFFSVPFSREVIHDPMEDALAALKLTATFVSVDRN